LPCDLEYYYVLLFGFYKLKYFTSLKLPDGEKKEVLGKGVDSYNPSPSTN
jgi:hypothetical protein